VNQPGPSENKSSHNTRKAYLIDASIYLFQAHFSPYVECSGSDGNDLSAIYGFSQFLLQFIRRVEPAYLAVALDESLFCGFRHELCPDYKSNRELPDENLARQLDACHGLCQALGVVAFASKKYEADDIIGTLASRLRQQSQSITIEIVSKDKDLAQLLRSDEDCLWDYSSNRRRFSQQIVEQFGVSPDRLPDYLGLVGDAVDCISGVPGVGPVKAKHLLAHFSTIEELYQNLDKVNDLSIRGGARLFETLALHQAEAELSKKLATIAQDVNEPEQGFSRAEINHLLRRPANPDLLDKLLQDLLFQQHVQQRLVNLATQLSSALVTGR